MTKKIQYMKKTTKDADPAKMKKVKSIDLTKKTEGIRNHQNLLKKVLVHLSSVGIFCYANNTGSIKGANRYQQYGFPGSPDILGILPNGQYLGIEIKTGNAVQNKNQKKFKRKIDENHGMFVIIHSMEELLKWISLWRQGGSFDAT